MAMCISCLCHTALTLVICVGVQGMAASAAPPVDFDRDVRAVLSDACFKCHGPDAEQRKAKLRLDTKEGLFGQTEAGPVIAPGKPEQSELLRRVTSKDAELRMPPASSGKTLSPAQIDKLRQWIAGGAPWQRHWAFVPPLRPSLPKLTGSAAWPHNAIDYFTLARLHREGLTPSPEADRTTLVRRVTLDLTGLPPTPEEVAAFLADRSPDAYERLVDRLLASPRYGERMAVPWLNAARYADTSGYQNDGPRHMWRWRDWVIDAFNANQPFDQFTIEQIAGDLLPSPALAQRIATGFNRNHRGNAEGGIIAEEYHAEYVADRVETTFTVWQGLTIGCARCHSHKYDPLTQRDYYQVFAYFNNLPEYGRAIKEGNSPPYLKAPTDDEQRRLIALRGEATAAESRFQKLRPRLEAAVRSYEAAARSKSKASSAEPIDWAPSRGLVAHFPLESAAIPAQPKSTKTTDEKPKDEKQKSVVIPPSQPPTFAAGQIGRAATFTGRQVVAADVAKFGYFDKFSFSAWIEPRHAAAKQAVGNANAAKLPGGTILSRMTDEAEGEGYSLRLVEGRVQLNLVKRWLDDAIRVETERQLPPDRWTHVTATYDGSRKASGVTIYIDGQPEKLRTNYDFLNQTFALAEPLRIGGGFGPQGGFHGRIDEVRIYDRVLAAEETRRLATAESISDILALAPARRSTEQVGKLQAWFLERQAPAELREAHSQMIAAREAVREFDENLPTVMVMQDMPTPRATHILVRGQYDKRGDRVEPGVPGSLAPPPANAPSNRMALARWLVDPANPLTARVAVNRFWEQYFGVGLVKTSEDFGTQGERPSHPELLDWLATELIRTGWDVKALQRLIVTSATYRQSSRASRELVARDLENRLLARGPRFRLSAETIRDQALAASGLLAERLGGPSVKIYQPDGLWSEIATDTDYPQDHGAALYRRGMYTYWKRTVAPPMMATFDASARETCTVRPTRTNTPLQALALMNETAFVEASRHMAERILTHGGVSDEARIRYAVRLAIARAPSVDEESTLLAGLRYYRERFRRDPVGAKALLTVGEEPSRSGSDPVELAAYSAIAGLVLNLDEAVTKE